MASQNTGDTTFTRPAPELSSPFTLRAATSPPPMITTSRSVTSSIMGYAQDTCSLILYQSGLKDKTTGNGAPLPMPPGTLNLSGMQDLKIGLIGGTGLGQALHGT